MSKQRATFGKRQRELDKQAKAAAKRERRASRADQDQALPGPTSADDQERVLTDLADLHQSYEAGELGLEEFETRRDELRAGLRID